jgi:uncharacterized protein YecE (DUF72 family)
MDVFVGTSGFSYDEWKGVFYPEKLKPAERLRYYAARLRTVEVNNTFYRMPRAELLARWRNETPEGFVFVLKASQRITHRERLKDSSDSLAHFFENAEALGAKLGPTLFQLPPNFKKDTERLGAFLELLRGRRAALEFRHESWMDEEVFALLRSHGVALCAADTDDSGEAGAPLVPTADWGYLRLRRAEYSASDLAAWAERLRAQGWSDCYVFFKHEVKGPALAQAFETACRANS